MSNPPSGNRLHRWRSPGIRLFSSASDAPRARRPTDLLLLIASVAGIALLSFPAPGPTAIDDAVVGLVQEIPGLFGWFWELAYDALIAWAVFLLAAALFAHRRGRLFADLVLAAVLAAGASVAASGVAGTDWSQSIRALTSTSSPPIYLAVRLAIATAVVVAASPHMSRPIRTLGRWILGVGAFAGIALGTTLPIGMTAGFLIGIGSAAVVHLLSGSPGGRLALDQVADALRELGVDATDLHDLPLDPSGVARTSGSIDGRPIVVKTFGRDAWDGQLLTSIWLTLWHRGHTPSFGAGRVQQVEHEAFVTLFAERAGIPVMPVVTAGTAAAGDALLVLDVVGEPLGVAHDQIDDTILRRLWDELSRLHDLGVAHGSVDGDHLVLRPDGSPAIADFGNAEIGAPNTALMTDRAQLLAFTSLVVGKERAVEAAADALGDGALGDVLPFLQPAVFDRATRRAVKKDDWTLKELRALAAERTGHDPPPLEQIRRVTWGSIATIAIIGFVAYALASAFSSVSPQELRDELDGANWAWLGAAVALTPIVQLPQAFSTIGATLQPVRFLPILMLQYGVQFIALAVPSSAARLALEIRFFERVGVPGAGALSITAIDSFSTFLLQVGMILVITLTGLASLDLPGRAAGSGPVSSLDWETLAIVVGVIVVAVTVAFAVPRFRALTRRLRTALREKAEDGREALGVLRRPSKLLLLFGGNLAAQLLLAIVLGLCLRAFGFTATLAELILVNTLVTLFAGFMPVPGGVGVAEAGYAAALAGLGIPTAAATSIAITYRLITFYLPPVWGAVAMRWMRKHSYL